jgi:hypothetical protein
LIFEQIPSGVSRLKCCNKIVGWGATALRGLRAL